MKKETRTVVYDDELRIEAYRFEGIVQPFPSHFHTNYRMFLIQHKGIGSRIVGMIIEYVDRETPAGGRSSIQLIAEKGKEMFYEKMGFKSIPNDFCGSGMRKVIHK